MGSHSSIHSKKALTARSKNLGISIIRYKNLQNRVISKILQKNMLLLFFKYIASSEILKKITLLFRYEFRFRFGKKSIFQFRSGFGEIPFRSFTTQNIGYLQLIRSSYLGNTLTQECCNLIHVRVACVHYIKQGSYTKVFYSLSPNI